jgi:hypothetical protein
MPDPTKEGMTGETGLVWNDGGEQVPSASSLFFFCQIL